MRVRSPSPDLYHPKLTKNSPQFTFKDRYKLIEQKSVSPAPDRYNIKSAFLPSRGSDKYTLGSRVKTQINWMPPSPSPDRYQCPPVQSANKISLSSRYCGPYTQEFEMLTQKYKQSPNKYSISKPKAYPKHSFIHEKTKQVFKHLSPGPKYELRKEVEIKPKSFGQRYGDYQFLQELKKANISPCSYKVDTDTIIKNKGFGFGVGERFKGVGYL
uniref:H-SHIPPO 1 n=1 Tax=Trepomonas sp. PC1 TaxID=1076344 RepID=A0A146KFQ8_9EUKA|eukprot:JAP94119.1 H-SHIPPO 1 [Trepomonas sp. PC1]